ncbi:MAG: hypothetical protein RLZZ135_1663 [Cyanobacteriota bacterium]
MSPLKIRFLIFWRVHPSILAVSVKPTKSGVASIKLASGIAFLTSTIALETASKADDADRIKSSAIHPCLPIPIKASSHPASYSR